VPERIPQSSFPNRPHKLAVPKIALSSNGRELMGNVIEER
jgi:hypothetical protein